jgi:predicted Zn-dependent protease
MVNAGLDPNGQSRMYERMQRAYRFTRRPPEFLLTHPLSETRISDSKNNARAYQIDNVTASTAFQMMKIRSETKYEKNRAVGLNKYRKLAQRDPSNLAYQYGLALALANNNFPGESLEVFEKIKVSLPNTIIMFAAYTDLLRQTGHHEKVQALLKERLSLSPENQPLSMILARSLTATKQFKEAENILIRQSKTRPLDVDVWYELAETSGLAGNISGVHIARAEYFLLHGAYSRSIQHLEYAKSLTRRNNPQLQAKLAQQIQDLKTIVRMAKG